MTVNELAEAICICTGNHDPNARVECGYAMRAARKVASIGWQPRSAHRLALLRAVLSYVDSHADADLPLSLLEEIRSETGQHERWRHRIGIFPPWDGEVQACDHQWLDRPESDSRECLICGDEVVGP